MQDPRTLKRHASLVDEMATARGIDLVETVMRGRIDVVDISDAVLRCTLVPMPKHCSGWLAEQEGVARSSPGYCRNADFFEKLAPKVD